MTHTRICRKTGGKEGFYRGGVHVFGLSRRRKHKFVCSTTQLLAWPSKKQQLKQRKSSRTEFSNPALAVASFLMNWKNSTLYWIRLWRKWTFCLRTALSITAGILQSEEEKKNKHLVISLIKKKQYSMVVTHQKVLKIRNKQATDHDFLFPWLLHF